MNTKKKRFRGNIVSLSAGVASAFLLGFVGAAAFALSFLFRIQVKHLEQEFINKVIPIDYSFGKTFKLFSIYEKPRKLLHSYGWILLVWVTALLSPAFLAYLTFRMLPSVGAISFLVVITGLNLLVLREGFEAYGFSREILATQVTSIGAGDKDF